MKKRTGTNFLLLMLVGAQVAAAATVDMTTTVTGTVDEPVQSVTVATAIGSVTASVSSLTFTAANVPLAFGPNTITVAAKDLAGNTGSKAITVHVRKNFTIRGTVADESPVTVIVNSVPATINSGVFTADVPLSLGLNPVTAVATDSANNTTSVTIDVFVARKPVDHP